MTTNDTFANKFFSATRAASLLEGKLVDQLIEIAEKRVDEPDDWDFDDIIFDDYDGSVEYRGASSSLVFTDEQAQKIFDLGFKRFWIVYTDGTERYYIPGHMTHKSSVIPRDCGKRRRDLVMKDQLLAAIDEEPECPGEMPDAMYQTILNLDKPAMEQWCRILVRETKQGIRNRILAQVNSKGAYDGNV